MYNNNRINQFQQQQAQQQAAAAQYNQYNAYGYGGGQYQQQGMMPMGMQSPQYRFQQQQQILQQQQQLLQQQQLQQQTNDIDLSLYIGDLGPDVTEQQLLHAFQSRFPSVRAARVIMDSATGISRGYGFVKFGNEMEKDKALVDMNGFYLNNRQIKVNNPTHKRLNSQNSTIPDLTSTDPNNTAIYVSQLDHYIDEGVLQTIFGAYGEISYIKMLTNKFSAFVNYVHRESAEAAFGLNNYQVGTTRLKVQWGKNMAPPPKSPPMTPTSNPILGNPPALFSNSPINTLTTSPLHHNILQQQQPQQQYNNQNDYNNNYNNNNNNSNNNNNNFNRKNNSIYDFHHSYFSREQFDITKAYSIEEENKAFISWNKDQFSTNFYSPQVWGISYKERDGPDSVLEA